MGLKFSTPVFLGVEDLTVYFVGSKSAARIFLGSNFCQANGCDHSLLLRYINHEKKNISSSCVPRLVNLDHETLFLFQQKASIYTVLKIAFLGCNSHVFFWVQNIRLRRTPPVTFISEYLPPPPPWESIYSLYKLLHSSDF